MFTWYKSLDLGAPLFSALDVARRLAALAALAARGCHGVPVLMGDELSTLACTVDFFLKAQHWIVICCDISKYLFIFVILTSIYIYIYINDHVNIHCITNMYLSISSHLI